jgi:hypothetical protein
MPSAERTASVIVVVNVSPTFEVFELIVPFILTRKTVPESTLYSFITGLGAGLTVVGFLLITGFFLV